MKILKDTYPGYDSKSKVDAAINGAQSDIKARDVDGINQPYTARQWAIALVRTGETIEYIDKTKAEVDQEAADEARLEKEIKDENARAELLLKAKNDSEVKDQLIYQALMTAGFNAERLGIMWVREKSGKPIDADLAEREKVINSITAEIEEA